MPIYEYVCKKCGHKFDKMMGMKDPNPPCDHQTGEITSQKFGSSEVTVEPMTCGGETQKVMSRGTFLLKGGGWYKDGY